MENMMQRATATVAAADSVTLATCREGYFPRALEVAEFRANDLNTVWMTVRTDAASAITFRCGVRAGVCLRQGRNSVTLMGRLVSVDAADVELSGVKVRKGFCAVKFTSEKASMWIDRQTAHCNLAANE